MQKVDEEGIDLKMPEFDNWEEYHIVSKNFNNMMEKTKKYKKILHCIVGAMCASVNDYCDIG